RNADRERPDHPRAATAVVIKVIKRRPEAGNNEDQCGDDDESDQGAVAMGAERWPQSRADTEAVPNPIGSFFARRRFRPTLWPTLGVAVLVAATASLGNWQRRRGLETEALRSQYECAACPSVPEWTGVSVDAP